MMAIRKRGSSYQVRVRPFPDVTFPTKEAAETFELNQKLRVKLGDLFQEKSTTFGLELDQHLERKTTMGGPRGKLRPSTVAFYEQAAAPWKPLRDMPVVNLRRSAVEDHISKRARVAPVAARNELQLAKAVLRAAASRGQTVDRGIFDIPAVRHEAVEGRALTLDQLDAIAAWLPDRIQRIVPFCGTVGLRFSEAVGLTDSMLDIKGAAIEIPRDLNKGRRTKRIPLAVVEVQLLREQLLARPAGARYVFANALGGRYSKSGFRSVWTPALERSGLEGFRFHWLRHTAISLMAQAGMAPETIALRVGHADGGGLILRRYRHLFPSEVSTAVGLVDVLVRSRVVTERSAFSQAAPEGA